MRYNNESESTVRAYEWCEELRKDAATELPDAIACGMASSFE